MEKERAVGALVGHALARALFEELGAESKKRIAQRAIGYLPRRPDPLNDKSATEIYDAVYRELNKLAAE